jgi:hypothetical protein
MILHHYLQDGHFNMITATTTTPDPDWQPVTGKAHADQPVTGLVWHVF